MFLLATSTAFSNLLFAFPSSPQPSLILVVFSSRLLAFRGSLLIRVGPLRMVSDRASILLGADQWGKAGKPQRPAGNNVGAHSRSVRGVEVWLDASAWICYAVGRSTNLLVNINFTVLAAKQHCKHISVDNWRVFGVVWQIMVKLQKGAVTSSVNDWIRTERKERASFTQINWIYLCLWDISILKTLLCDSW